MKKLTLLFIICVLFTGCATRPWTDKELALAAASTAAAYGNYRVTKHNLDLGPGHVEVNPIIGRRPSDAKLAGYFAISHFIWLGCAHYFNNYRSEILWLKTTINVVLIIHDKRETR